MIPSENRHLNDPVLTSKVWDNELANKTEFREGHGWSEIMDKVKEGDKVINGVGQVFICTYQTDRELIVSTGNEIFNNGFNWSVHLHPTKKDGTLNKGMSHISFVNFGTGWSRV